MLTYPNQALKLCLHWRRLRDNAGNSDTHYLLALATLVGATEIGMILIAKVSKEGDIVDIAGVLVYKSRQCQLIITP